MTISARQFFTTKPKVIEYMTLKLYHPAFGYLRYVANQFNDKTLGGEVFTGASMIVTETIQDERNAISYEIQLGRVGTQVKGFIKAIDAMEFGWMTAVDGTVAYYLSSDLDNPYRPEVTLSVGNVSMESESVVITLDTANPRNKSVARRYNTDDFPGTGASV